MKKKLILAASLLILLLIILVVHGPKKADDTTSHANLKIPPPHVRDETGFDKMAFYKKADDDSIRLQDQRKKDSTLLISSPESPHLLESHIDEKLTRLHNLIETPSPVPTPNPPRTTPSLPASDVDRLEHLLKNLKTESSSPSPEIETLTRLLASQHPTPKPDTQPINPMALPVTIPTSDEYLSTTSAKIHFYDLDNNGQPPPITIPLIEAQIPQTQTLVDGGLLTIELKTDLLIRTQRIPAGTTLYGTAHLNTNRMHIQITSIQYQHQIFPVALEVIGLDGLPGLDASAALRQQFTRDLATQNLTNLGPSYFDPSLTGQAATSGIQIARSLAGRKTRQFQLPVKAGYQILLHDLTQSTKQ
ncbi:MAG: conjugative transposon protein TraM [Bacteroidetes bacterium]|nr:conjugative transposon protein TraM [Bacteroidota bacterium]